MDPTSVLEVSAACDLMGELVAAVVCRDAPDANPATVAAVASIELFAACQDCASLFSPMTGQERSRLDAAIAAAFVKYNGDRGA